MKITRSGLRSLIREEISRSIGAKPIQEVAPVAVVVPAAIAGKVSVDVWNSLDADTRAAVESMLDAAASLPGFLYDKAIDNAASLIDSAVEALS